MAKTVRDVMRESEADTEIEAARNEVRKTRLQWQRDAVRHLEMTDQVLRELTPHEQARMAVLHAQIAELEEQLQ